MIRRRIVVVFSSHGLHAAEAGVAQGGDAGLRAPRNHAVGAAVGDHAEGLADGVRARGAGGGDAVVGALAAALDADDARGGVAQERGDGEERYL